MDFRMTDDVRESDRQEIFRGLLEYNLSKIEDRHPRELGIYWEDPEGRKQAGLIGSTHGNWLTVQYLWVAAESRGRGVGSSLLRQAEAEALQRGCKYAFLDTFGFQAPDFYRKYGYAEAFVLNEYPVSGKRYYFTKAL